VFLHVQPPVNVISAAESEHSVVVFVNSSIGSIKRAEACVRVKLALLYECSIRLMQ
jgi:hypothetical protein